MAKTVCIGRGADADRIVARRTSARIHLNGMPFQSDTGSGYQLHDQATARPAAGDARHHSDAVVAIGLSMARVPRRDGAEASARVEIMNATARMSERSPEPAPRPATFAGDPSSTSDGQHVVFNKFVAATEHFVSGS